MLAIERCGRLWTRDGRLLRLPQEDMCQALSVPPNLKYQADGGPDNQAIMNLLKASDTPTEDQAAYLKAQLVFWLIGATDGHGKNFSIFLRPGQHFRMTPLYDILTAQPSVDAVQVNAKRFKLAMSVGDNNHYHIGEVTPRHFLQTANFDAGIVREAMENLLGTAKAAAEKTIADLGNQIPCELAVSALAGISARLNAIALWKMAGDR